MEKVRHGEQPEYNNAGVIDPARSLELSSFDSRFASFSLGSCLDKLRTLENQYFPFNVDKNIVAPLAKELAKKPIHVCTLVLSQCGNNTFNSFHDYFRCYSLNPISTSISQMLLDFFSRLPPSVTLAEGTSELVRKGLVYKELFNLAQERINELDDFALLKNELPAEFTTGKLSQKARKRLIAPPSLPDPPIRLVRALLDTYPSLELKNCDTIEILQDEFIPHCQSQEKFTFLRLLSLLRSEEVVKYITSRDTPQRSHNRVLVIGSNHSSSTLPTRTLTPTPTLPPSTLSTLALTPPNLSIPFPPIMPSLPATPPVPIKVIIKKQQAVVVVKSQPTVKINHKKSKSIGIISESIKMISAASESTSSAFPAIQPKKAAAHFDEPSENFGEWMILLSGRAIRDFRQLKDGKKFKIVQQKLVELSFGRFWADNQKKLVGTETEVPIYEAKVLNDLRLVYQIDMEDEGDISTQIIRVWGLESHNTLDRRVWEAISRHSSTRGREYRKRCLYRREALSKGANVQSVSLPQTFPLDRHAESTKVLENDGLTDKEMLELHDLLALSKFIPLSTAVVKSILMQDDSAAHVFNVSGKEREIIGYQGSSFVIGRSGTGKTTCIVFKILGVERSYDETPDLATRGRPRQIFLTQSPVLASKVKSYYSSIVTTTASAKLSVIEAEALAIEKSAKVEDLEDLEDEATGMKGLPRNFSQLSDIHFPLFISVDTLLQLLEADYQLDWGRKKRTEGHKQAFKRFAIADIATENGDLVQADFEEDAFEKIATNSASTGLWEHYVDALVFESWFHSFDQRLTRGLDPTICWSEILGTIRGSELAVETSNGYISRQQYLELSVRTSSTYADLRPAIYSIFEAYMERKGIQGDFDRADRTHALIRAFRTQGIRLENQVTHVYVDEVQDLLLANCSMLRFLTSNPHGWMFAGDTAQTIAAGSSFRFNDLKAVTYRCEERDAAQMKRKPVESALFTLGVNYRSHAGITEVGNLLVSSLLSLSPNSIDQLPAEKGAVAGPKPVWLSGHDEESFTNFLFGEGESGNAVEFGAEQCIIVRNEKAREALRERTSDIGLILTIEESKGLEFSDVLLYDFFSDSTATAHDWRVLLRLLPDPPIGLPAFDKVRHAVVGQELRHLYVAVTRARNILWFVDRDTKGDAVKEYFNELKVIKVCRPGDELPVIGATSSPEQWKAQGRAMYDRKNYRQAALCYRKAGAHLEESIALAYQSRKELRASARITKSTSSKSSSRSLDVAKLFQKCAINSSSTQAVSLFMIAADLFSSGDAPLQAAACYESAGEFETAVQFYLKGRGFDGAVRIVQTCHDIDEALREKVYLSARLNYFKTNQLEKVSKLFDSEESQIEFMDNFGLESQRRAFLIASKRFKEVAELEFESGNLNAAYGWFYKEGTQECYVRSLTTLLELLSQTLPLGSSDDWDFAPLKKAAQFVEESQSLFDLIEKDFEGREHLTREFNMYQLICQKNLPELLKLSKEFSKSETSRADQLLALDVALSEPPEFDKSSSLAEVRNYLINLKDYTSLVKGFLKKIDIADLSTRRLFGLDARTVFADERAALRELRVLPTSPLIDWLETDDRDSTEGGSILVTEVHNISSKYLADRLDNFLFDSSLILLKIPALLAPCSTFSLLGACTQKDCKQLHLEPRELTEALYQERLFVVARTVDLMSNLDKTSSTPEENAIRQAEQDKWSTRFASSLYPPYNYAGGVSDIVDAGTTEEFQVAITAISTRAEKRLLSYNRFSTDVLWTFFQSVVISSDFNKKNLAKLSIASQPTSTKLQSGQSITDQIVNFMSLKSNERIMVKTIQGTSQVIQLVADKYFKVDCSFFLHFVEEFFILTLLKPLRWTGGMDDWSWNGIILPLDLMRRLINGHRDREVIQFVPPAKMRKSLLESMLKIASEILEGSGRFTHEGLPLDGNLRFLFAHRLIRFIIIITLNTPQHELRSMVELGIKKMAGGVGLQVFHPLIRPFLNANTLAVMQHGVIDESSKFLSQQLIQLDLTPEGTGRVLLSGIKPYRSPTLSGIERQLFKKSFNPRAQVFVPKVMRFTLEPEIEVEEVEEEVQNIPPEEILRLQEEENRIAEIKEKKLKAGVIIIQRWYRKILDVRSDRTRWEKTPLSTSWVEYRQESCLVRGPVVELLLGLETQKKRVKKAKDLLKKKMDKSGRDVDHAELGTGITNAGKLYNRLISMTKGIAPRNSILNHPTQLRNQLSKSTSLFNDSNFFLKSISKMVESIPLDPKVVVGFSNGVKGLLRTAKEAKPIKVKEIKPSLGSLDNADDDIEDDEDEAEKRGRRIAGGL